jgi:homogentisate 1,2-dioxygenase
MMTPHGPDAETFEKASKEELKPFKLRPDGLAFMFETSHFLTLTQWAVNEAQEGGKVLQKDYFECWQGMKKHFDPKNPNAGPQ